MSSKNLKKTKEIIYIIEKIKNIRGLHTDTEVAKELKMTIQNLNGYKQRGTLPIKAISDFCLRNNILINDILTGESEYPEIRDPRPGYSAGNPPEIEDLLDKTRRILTSDNPTCVAAMKAGIAVLYELIDTDKQKKKKGNPVKKAL